MHPLFLIFLGGGLGASARYLISLGIQAPQHRFPYGILSCNLIGCLIIGIFYGYVKAHHPTWLSPLLVTGFLGGFTTFSSFGMEVHGLFNEGFISIAIVYILLSLIGGISLCFLGYTLGAKI